MAGKSRELSPAQQLALAEVRATQRRYVEGKLEVEQRVRDAVRREIDALEMQRTLAVRNAFDLGVPKRRIGMDGLSTTDAGTVNRILERVSGGTLVASVPVQGIFSWADRAAGIVAVRYPSFPTTSTTEDYPTILSGTVRVAPDATKYALEVLTDDSDQPTDFGPIPGMLRWELEFAAGTPGALAAMIVEWAESNR